MKYLLMHDDAGRHAAICRDLPIVFVTRALTCGGWITSDADARAEA